MKIAADRSQNHRPFMLELNYRKAAPASVGFQSHDNYEIFYFHEGNGYYLIGDSILSLKPGTLIIMHGLTMHSPCMLGENDYVRTLINFDPSGIRPIADSMLSFNLFRCFERIYNGVALLQDEAKEEFEQILARMHCFNQPSETHQYSRFLLAFIELLILVDGQFSKKMLMHANREHISEKAKTVQCVITFLEQNYTEDLTLDTLSHMLNFNKYYLSRVFKEVTGLTVFQYVYRRRVNAAKIILISDETTSITEIAHHIGFINASHFCKTFKAHSGQTPERYRRIMHGAALL
jgi:AraC-like DNA-binding protein